MRSLTDRWIDAVPTRNLHLLPVPFPLSVNTRYEEMSDEDTANDRMEELRKQFHVFDADGSGFIEKNELQQGLKILGYQISDEGFENLLRIVGSKDDRLDFDEFLAWNRELFKEEIKTEFNAIDTDGSGWISKAELKAYSMKMKYGLTEEQIDDFLYGADKNENDRVGLDEYISAVVCY